MPPCPRMSSRQFWLNYTEKPQPAAVRATRNCPSLHMGGRVLQAVEPLTAEKGDLVNADNSVSDVVQGDLAVPIHIQNVKGLLRLLGLQEVLQVLCQDVCPADQHPAHEHHHHLSMPNLSLPECGSCDTNTPHLAPVLQTPIREVWSANSMRAPLTCQLPCCQSENVQTA